MHFVKFLPQRTWENELYDSNLLQLIEGTLKWQVRYQLPLH